MKNFFWKDFGSNYCNKQTDTFRLMQWHLKRRGMLVVWYGDKCHWKLMSSVMTTSGPRHRCWGSWRTSSGWSWSRSGMMTATSYSTTSWTRQADTTRTSQSSEWKASSAKRDAVILCCQNLKTDLIEYWENNLIIRFWLSKGGNPSPASGFNLAPILKIHDFWGCVIEDSDKDLIYYKRCNLQSLGMMVYILLCGYPPFSGSCGQRCGWDEGGFCDECQRSLFDSIKVGTFVMIIRLIIMSFTRWGRV